MLGLVGLMVHVHLLVLTSWALALGLWQALRDGNKQAQMEEAPLVPGESIKAIGECLTLPLSAHHK